MRQPWQVIDCKAHINECWHLVVNAPSISQSHFCVVGATHKSNAEALSVVPFFSPSAQTPAFARPVFFAPLSTDYKKTKGVLVVYNHACSVFNFFSEEGMVTPKAEHGNLLILLSDFHYRRSQNNAPYSGNYSEFINKTLCLGIVFLFCTCINFSVSSVLAQWVRFPDSASCVDCWFSSLLQEVFPRVLWFSPLLKSQSTIWYEFIWVNFLLFFLLN